MCMSELPVTLFRCARVQWEGERGWVGGSWVCATMGLRGGTTMSERRRLAQLAGDRLCQEEVTRRWQPGNRGALPQRRRRATAGFSFRFPCRSNGRLKPKNLCNYNI